MDAPEVRWVAGEERHEVWQDVERRLGYTFRNPYLRDMAMMSTSWVKEQHDQGQVEYEDNKRLEWLGDALVYLCATLRVLRQSQGLPTGKTTPKRVELIKDDALARAGVEVGLAPLLLLGQGEIQTTWRSGWVTYTARAVEALVGAIWVDVKQAQEGGDPLATVRAVCNALVPDVAPPPGLEG